MASYLDGTTSVSVGVSIVLFNSIFHLNPWMIGVLVSGFQLAFAVGAIVGGRLGDVFGRRAVYSVDLLICAMAMLVIIIAPNPAVLVVGFVITGLALGADIPASVALVFEEASAGRRGSAVAMSQVFLFSGVVLTQFIGIGVSDLGGLGARLLFVHPVVVSLIVWFLRREMKESPAWEQANVTVDARARRKRDLRLLLSQPYGSALIAITVFYVFSSVSGNITGQYSTYLITTISKSTVLTATIVSVGTTLLLIAAGVAFQRLVDRTAARRVLFVLGTALTAVGSLVPVTAGFSLWSVVVMLCATGVGFAWAGEGLFRVWTQEIFPTEIRSTSQGLTYGIGRFAIAGYGVFVPALAATGPTALMVVMAACGAVTALLGLLWIPQLTRARSVARSAGAPLRLSRARG
ncbi:MFS transporter [Streptomyces sp. NBC_01262]|uniref:MFS transporter n=1 Tax=Streptomyces sp. NBC_01262 TaxID=2903803 RepID=UPI002E3337F7|nr:MFS transporter [Streptomyces sp. NBC_01262]